MKAQVIRKPKAFEPFSITITFESEKEYDRFKDTIVESDFLSDEQGSIILTAFKK